MTLSVQLIDSIKTIEGRVNVAIADYLNDAIAKKQNQIFNQFVGLIPAWIKQQPEIQSILSSSPGSLVGQFGITMSPSSIVDSIINSVVSTAQIKFSKYSKSLKGGGLVLTCQPSNMANLLALPEGHTVYRGGDLHWMDWLLLRGDTIIIANYQYNPATGIGRSGLGNMIDGGSFRVPPEFSGTKEDNFITRALVGKIQEQQVANIISKAIG